MVIKAIISDKGKAWRIEKEGEMLSGKSVGDKVEGKELMPELEGYELEITGGSDSSGFPLAKDVEGLGLRRLLLKQGFGMKDNREGVRLRKTVRGKIISATTAQINLKVSKHGSKKLNEVFSQQNLPKEKKKYEAPAAAPAA
jgi:small subunit ribosomal protein S6e